MKINNYFCIVIVILSVAFCIYQATKKENIYISFEDLKGYKYQFIDSTDVLKTRKILIKHGVKSGNQFLWEINIGATNIKKIEPLSIQDFIVNSQFFIINNFGFYGNKNDLLKKTDKYQIYIIRNEKEVAYILPVKDVHFIVAGGGSE